MCKNIIFNCWIFWSFWQANGCIFQMGRLTISWLICYMWWTTWLFWSYWQAEVCIYWDVPLVPSWFDTYMDLLELLACWEYIHGMDEKILVWKDQVLEQTCLLCVSHLKDLGLHQQTKNQAPLTPNTNSIPMMHLLVRNWVHFGFLCSNWWRWS